jgi:phosphoenolpyruvate carboxykinase (ATP)
MDEGRVNPDCRIEAQGFTGVAAAYYNFREPQLIEHALKRGEGTLGQGGTLLVTTGKHTGRSPRDKFVVRTPTTDGTVWWENNRPMAPDALPVCAPTWRPTWPGATTTCRTCSRARTRRTGWTCGW